MSLLSRRRPVLPNVSLISLCSRCARVDGRLQPASPMSTSPGASPERSIHNRIYWWSSSGTHPASGHPRRPGNRAEKSWTEVESGRVDRRQCACRRAVRQAAVRLDRAGVNTFIEQAAHAPVRRRVHRDDRTVFGHLAFAYLTQIHSVCRRVGLRSLNAAATSSCRVRAKLVLRAVVHRCPSCIRR